MLRCQAAPPTAEEQPICISFRARLYLHSSRHKQVVPGCCGKFRLSGQGIGWPGPSGQKEGPRRRAHARVWTGETHPQCP